MNPSTNPSPAGLAQSHLGDWLELLSELAERNASTAEIAICNAQIDHYTNLLSDLQTGDGK